MFARDMILNKEVICCKSFRHFGQPIVKGTKAVIKISSTYRTAFIIYYNDCKKYVLDYRYGKYFEYEREPAIPNRAYPSMISMESHKFQHEYSKIDLEQMGHIEDNIKITLRIHTSNIGDDMHKAISKVFENTLDALLVQKHLGSQIQDNFIYKLIVKDHKDEIFAEAKRLEEEQIKNEEV